MFAKKLYEDISEGRERLELEYYSTVYSNLEGRKDYAGEMAEEYLSCLQNNLEDDIRAGFTQKGVHRDDLAGTDWQLDSSLLRDSTALLLLF